VWHASRRHAYMRFARRAPGTTLWYRAKPRPLPPVPSRLAPTFLPRRAGEEGRPCHRAPGGCSRAATPSASMTNRSLLCGARSPRWRQAVPHLSSPITCSGRADHRLEGGVAPVSRQSQQSLSPGFWMSNGKAGSVTAQHLVLWLLRRDFSKAA